MLGRNHLLLSLFTAALILVPYFKNNAELTLLVLLGVAIGSLTPDADSKDAAIFHEHVRGVKGNLGTLINGLFAPIFPIFGWVTRYAIYHPSIFILKNSILKKYNIGERHRGFLHSFIGIGTALMFTTIYLLIILLLLNLLNIWYLLLFMTAYVFGALMHLLEDSATVTGIQWNYPFSPTILKGHLITRPEFAKKPDTFMGILGISIIALFFSMELEWITFSNWLITLLSILFLLIAWFVFLKFIARIEFTGEEIKIYDNMKSYF